MKNTDAPGIVVHPVLVLVAFLVLGTVLDRIWPLPYPVLVPQFVGYVILAFSAVLLVAANREFSRYQIELSCSACATTLLVSGPFRFTRNPVYVAFLMALIGLSVIRSNLWLAAVVIPAGGLLFLLVISKEEVSLARRFGNQYDEYRSSVRRWL
ncbi:MAG: isoprenylcysteine carboxylmethyltransferase family protein [Gemmatimonadales bacterium]|nr:isoprenylcysteine carboxylmethyltransferase family protein [Gemmatimonadales bacterium]MDZ4389735.1 isoprenylcysteine carboxylmethyltransferase family protein [Gemmatimonadales bacterium]